MHSHTDKKLENKSQSVANEMSQKQDGEPALQFSDNRVAAIVQRKLQKAVNTSPRVLQLKSSQDMANNSSRSRRIAQCQAMENNRSSKQSHIIQKMKNSTGLPGELKLGIEKLSGYSMDDVKVHYNSDKPTQLQAHAYAQGTDIHVASGQEKHLPHEAWHVVQQKQGRVKPTQQLASMTINDDIGLEKEADKMGLKALQMKGSPSASIVKPQVGDDIQLVEEESQLATPSSRLIVNDDILPNKSQLQKDAFLSALKKEIRSVADQVLLKIGQTSSDCPYIPFWFDYYQSRNSEHLLKAITRYAPAASNAKTWQELIQIISKRVMAAFTKHIATGSLEDVPEEVPKDLMSKEEADSVKEVGQLKSDIAQFCRDCFGSGETGYRSLEMDVVNNLPDWGGAVRVGFHSTGHWREVQQSGEFRAGGGRLGPGIYVGGKLAGAYAGIMGDNAMFLEVGYVGDQSAWVRHQINLSEYDESMEGQYDVLEVTGAMGQTCFKSNGPNHIDFANFRVRPAQR